MSACVLCDSTNTGLVHHSAWADKQYIHCYDCDLIHLKTEFHPSAAEEKQRYLLHENSEAEGYVQFLKKIIDPALQRAGDIKKVLDYGSGPTPTLVKILQQRKISCDCYDPYFSSLWPTQKYDLVFCTEVVEHFRQPKKDWEKLLSTLAPAAYLGILTQTHSGPEHFKNWWYPRDLTHLSFYSEKTLRYLTEKEKLALEFLEAPAFIFRK